jgi:hypothetical protein
MIMEKLAVVTFSVRVIYKWHLNDTLFNVWDQQFLCVCIHVNGHECLHSAWNCPTIYKQQDDSRSAVQTVVYLGIQRVRRDVSESEAGTEHESVQESKNKGQMNKYVYSTLDNESYN